MLEPSSTVLQCPVHVCGSGCERGGGSGTAGTPPQYTLFLLVLKYFTYLSFF